MKKIITTIIITMGLAGQAHAGFFDLINTVQNVKGMMDTAEAVNTISSMKEANDNQGLLKDFDLIMFQKSNSVNDDVFVETIKMYTIQTHQGLSIFGGGSKTKGPTIGIYSYDYPTDGKKVALAYLEERKVDGIAGVATIGQEHYTLTIKLPETEDALYTQDIEAPNNDTDQIAGSLIAVMNQLIVNK